ncbi:MAG: polymerase sigma-70 factor, subfamily [Micromonosporaceae bacterium]|jgi:RNA polymerase sigma-70 factor (ECF subfamily)|nr:polymerase sigma-70 factor, subfamily [Micromonosporaceae bacterium]
MAFETGARDGDLGPRRLVPVPEPAVRVDASDLLGRVARGDEPAFAALYDEFAARVYGLIRRVLRDPALAEEVVQEVMLEVWRTAGRFDTARGSAAGWVLTIAHRRAVDRVRSEQAGADRTLRHGAASIDTPYDNVVESVTTRMEQQQVRTCLGRLTELQREAITLAYYGGHSYREVADLLNSPLATIKTRMRDGLIRMRDCLGVSVG